MKSTLIALFLAALLCGNLSLFGAEKPPRRYFDLSLLGAEKPPRRYFDLKRVDVASIKTPIPLALSLLIKAGAVVLEPSPALLRQWGSPAGARRYLTYFPKRKDDVSPTHKYDNKEHAICCMNISTKIEKKYPLGTINMAFSRVKL